MPEQCTNHQTFSRCTACGIEYHIPAGYVLVTESDVELLNAAAEWAARFPIPADAYPQPDPKTASTREHWAYQGREVFDGVDCYVFRWDIPADHPESKQWGHKVFYKPVHQFRGTGDA